MITNLIYQALRTNCSSCSFKEPNKVYISFDKVRDRQIFTLNYFVRLQRALKESLCTEDLSLWVPFIKLDFHISGSESTAHIRDLSSMNTWPPGLQLSPAAGHCCTTNFSAQVATSSAPEGNKNSHRQQGCSVTEPQQLNNKLQRSFTQL